ncbi:MAG: response regulator [Gammaproteobacteria bacterium]|nr:response regulator [Gammaproteobacteria bacterium]
MDNNRNNIIVVDDDHITRARLKSYFQSEGYQVIATKDGDEMWLALVSTTADIVLLDIGLPGKDGLELARELRTHHENIGIILVTGRNDDIDKIVGLECGADDYVTKPFHSRELLARVKNLLRRSRNEPLIQAGDNYLFSGWRIDLSRRRLRNPEGKRVTLTDGEFDLLSMLVHHPGVVLSRDRLMQAVSHRSWDPNDRTVDVLVRRLRRKIESDPQDPEFITTVRGKGYVFTAKTG